MSWSGSAIHGLVSARSLLAILLQPTLKFVGHIANRNPKSSCRYDCLCRSALDKLTPHDMILSAETVPPMKTATRFPIQRIALLDQEIRAGRYPNATTLSRLLEVAPRTIQRDIEFARDRMGIPIVFDPNHNGYTYSDLTFVLPSISLTEGELLAIFVAERAIRDHRATPFGRDLKRGFEKIQYFLSDRVTVSLAQLSESFSFHTTAATTCKPSVFAGLSKAIDRKLAVDILYKSMAAKAASPRRVDPYHLACVDGQWYLAAFCHLRRDVRLFVPSRIEELRETDCTFQIPSDFDIHTYLGKSLSVFRGDHDECYHVKLRLRGVAARSVSERVWHESQTLDWTPEGDLIFGLTLSHLREAEQFALRWGDLAEVLAPEELRTRVAETLRTASAQY